LVAVLALESFLRELIMISEGLFMLFVLVCVGFTVCSATAYFVGLLIGRSEGYSAGYSDAIERDIELEAAFGE
jgi:hypothetical protein